MSHKYVAKVVMPTVSGVPVFRCQDPGPRLLDNDRWSLYQLFVFPDN
jgi:hypothetical protein